MSEDNQLELDLELNNTTGGVSLSEGAQGGTHDDQSDPGTVALSEYITAKSMALEVALNKYDIVNVDERNGVMIMAERRTNQAFPILADPNLSTSELGSASPSPWTSWTREEHVPELRDRQGLTKFYRMKRNDGVVRGSLRGLKTALLSAH